MRLADDRSRERSVSKKGFIAKRVDIGDLVHARGRIRQNSFEKAGETVYTVDLICNEFSPLARKANRSDDDDDQN